MTLLLDKNRVLIIVEPNAYKNAEKYAKRGLLMIEWKKYLDQVRQGIAEIQRGYRILGDAGRQTDLFGVKTHELIALAVQCDGCIAVQTETVLQHRERKQLKQKR